MSGAFPSAPPPGPTGPPEAVLRGLAGLTDRAWLVGGALRDELLGRASHDVDLTVDGDARSLARALARRTGASAFGLSDAFGAWRVTAPDRAWQVDVTPLSASTLEADLANRDLTVNAIARPLAGGPLIDPFGGAADLAARRLVMVSPSAFHADPLRVLRLARIGADLGFEVDPDTVRAARAAAPGLAGTAAERIFAELRQVLAGRDPHTGLDYAEGLGASAVVLPELVNLHGVEQNIYHHRDVHGHTLEALAYAVTLTRDPAAVFDVPATSVAALLAEPVAEGMTRGELLRWGALLHDIAKPQTRAVSPEGRVTFFGHDLAGADLSRAILERLRASERVRAHVADLTRHHLRLGFLVHHRPLSARARYDYLNACDSVSADVTLLSIADRLATRGRNAEAAIAAHLDLARELWPAVLAYRAQPPRPPIRGDALAAELGRPPGPWLAETLAELTAARYAGELADGRAAAVAHARRWLAAPAATSAATPAPPGVGG
ncbi:HDIG domain-containing metalloprotein [Conexibacter sp. DBS9H8]|uniref:HDIG domain-containing metalloprotein n=1 Tax=Conexibacter sp. DBS9H8 TaxID=2937801 RepID=UPI0020104DB5|nr:HDIG domain-containing metalloprotein [Conexibacter sp. DBS9H8]